MAETYIVLKDDIIIKKYHTSQGEKGIMQSLSNEGITGYDEIKKVTWQFEGQQGNNINEFDSELKLKKLSDRVKDGYVIVPDKHILKGEKIRAMNLEEKVNAGFEEISPLMKVVKNDLIMKTDEELISDGIKTQEEIDEEKKAIDDEKLIQEEIRAMAIKRLKEKNKI